MAFGYKYWMVFLPSFNPESFLLFVHNPACSTKLRDYSDGIQRVVGQPRVEGVLSSTTEGRTRFLVEEHLTTDKSYWYQRTIEFNRLYLLTARQVIQGCLAPPQPGGLAAQYRDGSVVSGRAKRGSRRQIQDYVNEHPTVLSAAVLDVLPPRLRELQVNIQWVSPLVADNYREYRDADFMRAVGLEEGISELEKFWSKSGPSWDALARVSDNDGRVRPGVVLVEAKSYLGEIRGNGCQAGDHSRPTIVRALEETQRWYGVSGNYDWVGPLYQSANRLAHLYFIRERLKDLVRPAWLVNICFLDDPIGPTSRTIWEAELMRVRAELGLPQTVPHVFDVFLPALADGSGHGEK